MVRRTFKSGQTKSTARSGRISNVQSLRKNKEKAQHKRAMDSSSFNNILAGTYGTLGECAKMVTSLEPNLRLRGVKGIRHLLVSADSEVQPRAEILSTGVLPSLARLLVSTSADDPETAMEACWCLTNISAGSSNETQAVISSGVVSALVEVIMDSERPLMLRAQSVWVVGNIAGDSVESRNFMLQQNGFLQGLVGVIQSVRGADSRTSPDEVSLLRNCVWCFANLCRGTPGPGETVFNLALELFPHYLASNDPTIRADCCWGISYLADLGDEAIAALLDSGVGSNLVTAVLSGITTIQIPAVRACANLTSGHSDHVSSLMGVGLINALGTALMSMTPLVVKNSCWCLSNICADTVPHVMAVCNSGLLAPLTEVLVVGNNDVATEAMWVIGNACRTIHNGDYSFYSALMKEDAVGHILDYMSRGSPEGLQMALLSLRNLLLWGEENPTPKGENPALDAIIEADGEDVLLECVESENPNVKQLAESIVEQWWDMDDEEDDMAELEMDLNETANDDLDF